VPGIDASSGQGVRMLEILFLATREDVARTDVAGETVRYLVNYARLGGFELLAVAAVPQQGIQFWTKQRFKKSSAPPPRAGEISELAKTAREKVLKLRKGEGAPSPEEIDQTPFRGWGSWARERDAFLRNHMLVFVDTPLYVYYCDGDVD